MIRAAPLLPLLFILAACAAPHVQPPGEQQRPSRLEKDAAFVEDGYRLPLTIWPAAGPPRAIVLALHGLNDYRRAFDDLAHYLAGRGITTYAYDQRGFGESEGRGLWHGSEPMVRDLIAMANLLRARHPDLPLYLMGESMGGAVLLAAAAEADPPLPVQGQILIAPAVWGRRTMPFYQRWGLWLAAHTAPGKTLTGEGLDIQPTDNLEMLRAWAKDPWVIKATRVDVLWGISNLMDRAVTAAGALQVPTLILYGERDEIIPKAPTCRFLAGLPGHNPAEWELVLYPEGYHMLTRDLQAAVVWQDIADWVLGPEPGETVEAGADPLPPQEPDAAFCGRVQAASARREAVDP
jgi:alpha-beta hydrolase superfamily lysophospholipase